MSENKVKIADRELEISPLRCKHLKEISKMLANGGEKPTNLGVYADLERWMPFILASLQVKNPSMTEDELGEMTLQEYKETWEAIVALSGIKVVAKVGEVKAVPNLTGEKSSVESVPLPTKVSVN